MPARSAWPWDEKPKGIVRSCQAQQMDESTSAMGVRSEDFVEIIEETVEEVQEAQPAWAHIKAPVNKKGAKFVVNQNSREPAVEPEELAPMWKIFDLVGADWTYTSKGWAAENFCMFTGDDAAWKEMVKTRVDAINALEPEVWINTECGHSFFTIWKGVERFESPQRAEVGDSIIRVLRIDPQQFELRLMNASAIEQGRALSAKEWCRRYGLVAAMNASMYQQDYKTSVSLMRTRSPLSTW